MKATNACCTCGGSLTGDGDSSGVCVACALSFALDGSDEPLDAGTERVIGPYRLVQRIGEGGMGEVWEAEQTGAVHRRVALKLIKAGMDTRQVISRFEAERQALALMDHPCISKVLDAGATDEGRPFFVMEYVPGEPITDYCDRNTLTTVGRIELFLQVCDAVQHAHQRAIIHRDLKPSNILVSMQDGVAVPKVIDFGVAKATAQPLTEKSLFTEVGSLLGTPEYMSPEQADLTGHDVDTRTDVYSLGVILYELLAGALPVEPQAMREAGFDGLRRMIREVEPPKPSTRVGTLGGPRSSDAARQRCVDVPTLRRQLSGELDWITMRAIEKDRERRYGSPTELAADLRRHLNDEPVDAGPPSAAYRAKKFVRRHRLAVIAASLGVLALGAVAVVMTVQAARIAREAKAKQRVSEFLTELFTVSDPSLARGNSTTARELLDKGVTKIRGSLQDEPAVRAELMMTMGTVYTGLGLFEESESLLREAFETRRRVLGPDHPVTLKTALELGRALVMLLRDAEAEALLAPTVEAHKRVLGPEHPETLRCMGQLARAIWGQERERQGEAEALFVETLAIQKRVLGVEHPETLRSMHGLGLVYNTQERHREAESLLRETLEMRRRILGPDHPFTINSMTHLAIAYQGLGRHEEQVALLRQSLEIGERVLGPTHFNMVWNRVNLATALAMSEKRSEAIDNLRIAVDRGFSDPEELRNQPAFQQYAGSPDFEAIVAGAEKNKAKKER